MTRNACRLLNKAFKISVKKMTSLHWLLSRSDDWIRKWWDIGLPCLISSKSGQTNFSLSLIGQKTMYKEGVTAQVQLTTVQSKLTRLKQTGYQTYKCKYK